MDIRDLVQYSYANAKAHGFWDGPEQDNVPTKIALIHAEASEALEEFRKGRMELWFHEGQPEGFGIELADAMIRICDLAGRLGIDLDKMVHIKSEFNKTRPHMHGGRAV